MSPYLDPKNDVVFKRVFGEHANVLRAMLNAILPLTPDKRIVSLEYLPAELVPEIPDFKHTIVDVRCVDERGRHFIVEMQMQWTTTFMQRVLYNSSKAYVRQLGHGQNYDLLQPVIGLSLLNDSYHHDPRFLHFYELVEREDTGSAIEGLQLVFVELPKFHASGSAESRELWLRFLMDVNKSKAAADSLRGHFPELDEALDLTESSSYTPGQLAAYERYWDAISTEKTLISGKAREAHAVGLAEGEARGIAKGEALGIAKGEAKVKAEMLQKLMQNGMSENDAKNFLGI